MKILKLSKDTLEQFNLKFNWAKGKQAAATGYGSKPDGIMEIGEPVPDDDSQYDALAKPTDAVSTKETEQSKAPQTEEKKTFSFDDIEF